MTSPVVDKQIRRLGLLLHLAGLVVAIVCAGLAYEIVDVPTKRAIADAESRIASLSGSLEQASAARLEHEQLSQRIAEVKSRLQIIGSRVPAMPEEAEFLRQIGELARQQELTITNFRPGEIVHRERYSRMEVSLTGEGSYRSICAFFDGLAHADRLAKVRDLKISQVAGNIESTRYPLQAKLVIYFGFHHEPAEGREVERG